MSLRLPRTRVARRKFRRQSFSMQSKSQTAIICRSLTTTVEKERIPLLRSTRRSSRLILALWLPMKLICKIWVPIKRHCWARRINSIVLIHNKISWWTTSKDCIYQDTCLVIQSPFSILAPLTPVSSTTKSFSKLWLYWMSFLSRILAHSKIIELVMLEQSSVAEKGSPQIWHCWFALHLDWGRLSSRLGLLRSFLVRLDWVVNLLQSFAFYKLNLKLLLSLKIFSFLKHSNFYQICLIHT